MLIRMTRRLLCSVASFGCNVYHPQVIQANVEQAQAQINALAARARDPSQVSLELKYHSLAEVASAKFYFDERLRRYDYALERDPKTPAMKFDLEERRWIRNEKRMCQLDFLYWATRYAYIRSGDGRMIRYSPNTSQRIVHTLRAENELQRIAVAFIQLKARQLGVS